MNEQNLWLFFMALITLTLLIIVVATYRLWASFEHRSSLNNKTRKKPTTISLLIYANQWADNLQKTIASAKALNNKKVDYVVVLEGFDRNLRLPVDLDYPVIKRRQQTTKHAAYQAAYRKSQKGKVVLCLNAGDQIDKKLIERAVGVADKRYLKKVALPEIQKTDKSFISLVEKMNNLFWHRRRCVEVFEATYFRKTALLDVVRLPKWCFTLLAFATIVAALIFGFSQGSFEFVVFLWGLFMVYMIAMIWLGDETAYSKWQLIFFAPSALFALPTTSFIQGIFQFRKRK